MGLVERLRRLDNRLLGRPGQAGQPTLRAAYRFGFAGTALGVLLVLLDAFTDFQSSVVLLVSGLGGGLWFGRALEARARQRGQGLRDDV